MSGHPSSISIKDFTYELPPEKIAAYPLAERDAAKLLVFRKTQIEESVFRNLDNFLDPETLLVFNNARVIPARLHFLNSKNKTIELFCLEPAGNRELSQALAERGKIRWHCLVGNLKQWKEEMLQLRGEGILLNAVLVERAANYVVVDFSWEPPELCFAEALQAAGHMPIPPYLNRESEKTDELRYQTVYAEKEGSVAAPTAGLHFTPGVFEKLEQKQIQSLTLTLHVGAGTFKPVKSETMQGHDMHAEWMEAGLHTLDALLGAEEKKIIAVGTTSLRTLESLYWMGTKALLNPGASLAELEVRQWEPYELPGKTPGRQESLEALRRWMEARGLQTMICRTQILIAPPYELKMAAGIITNFHQPGSTLLLLISAIVGPQWKNIYNYALNNGFRFLSYGDSSLLFKG
jgi:S-adenosylmethionine:tRNA ribosyltransferase-isomerase